MKAFILFFSSVCGLGYIKYAPGTFGSLAGVLLWRCVMPQNFACHAFSLAVIFFVSCVLSYEAEKIYAKKDDQRIVIDEVAGVWFSACFSAKHLGLFNRRFYFV